MEQTSLKSRILIYLRDRYMINPDYWTVGGEIEREALNAGYSASNAARRMRELENEGLLEKKENEKGLITYRYNRISN